MCTPPRFAVRPASGLYALTGRLALALAVLALCATVGFAKEGEFKVKKWTYDKSSTDDGPVYMAIGPSEAQDAPGAFVIRRLGGDCGRVFSMCIVNAKKKGQAQEEWKAGAMRVDEKAVHSFQYRYSFPKDDGVAYVYIAKVENESALMDEMRQGTNLRIKFAINQADCIMRVPLAGFAEVSGKQVEMCASGGSQGKQAGSGQSQGQGDKKDKKEEAGGVGTGFFVNDQGYVITNYHVIKGGKKLTCEYQTTKYPAKLIKADAINDLALLKIEATPKAVLTFRGGKPVRTGEEVVAVGFPYYGFVSTHPSVTTGTINSAVGLGDDSRWLQMTAPIQPGNSGGPLVDMSGNVVGVVVATLDALAAVKASGNIPQNINFAIRTPLVKSFLEINEIAYNTAESTQDLKVVDVGEKTLSGVVLVVSSPQ